MLNKLDRRGVAAWGLGRHVGINCDNTIKGYCPSYMKIRLMYEKLL
jgi:hypothetical protein